MNFKPGDKVPTWFSGRSDGLSTVISVTPVTDRLLPDAKWVIRLTAPKTSRGWMELTL